MGQMGDVTQPRKPGSSEEPDSPPVQVKVEQQVGAVTGGKVVGIEVHHAEAVIIDAGAAAAPPAPGDPPYKGLDFYDVADAPLFFGRERLTAELVQYVRNHAFLAIIGASGSGKSSLARAGLVAALLGRNTRSLEDGVQPPLGSRDWRCVAVSPTAHPFEALARGLAGEGAEAVALLNALVADPLALRERAPTLAGTGDRLLLLVDQFEELFTLCKDAQERAAYVDALLTACGGPTAGVAGSPCTVILTVRADFYDRCIGFENLRAALEDHQKPIGAMNRAELQRTIELPAQAGQWAFQQGLPEQILDDVGDQPGNLPLLSYALLETWKRRSGRIMTLAGYREAGGVAQAISRTAEHVYDDLSRQGLGDAARRILLSLVEPGDEGRATRRRELRSALAPGDSQSPEARVLLALSARDARLVTVDGDALQISHEALITAWPRLGEWLDTYRDDLQRLSGVRDAAAAWRDAPATEKENLLVHRGGRLDDAVRLRDAGEFTMAENESVYLNACLALRDQEIKAERKRNRDRFRLIAGAATIALVLALLAAVAALWARKQQRIAEDRGVQLAAQVTVAADARATAEAEAERAGRQAGLALSRQLAAESEVARISGNHDTALLLAIEAGNRASTAEAFAALRRMLAQPGRTIKIEKSAATAAPPSEIGEKQESVELLVESDETGYQLRDPATGSVILTIPSAGYGEVSRAFLNHQRTRILTTSPMDFPGEATIWDIATLKSVPLSRPDFAQYYSGAWSPDDSRVITSGCGETGTSDLICVRGGAWVWDATTGEQLLTLSAHTGWVEEAEWTDAGTGILTTSQDETRRQWTLVGIPELPLVTTQEVAAEMASVSDAEPCEQTQYLREGDSDLFRAYGGGAFSASRRICAGTRSWVIGVSQALFIDDQTHTVLTDTLDPAFDAQLHVDAARAKHIAIGGCERNWDAGSSGIVICQQNSGFVEIRDADTGEALSKFAGFGDEVTLVSWSPDGRRLLAFSYNDRFSSSPAALPALRMLDVSTGEVLFAITNFRQNPERIAWSSDGTVIMVFHGDSVEQFFAGIEDLARSACLQASRNLTQAEWRRYLPDEPYRQTCPDLPAGE